LHFWEIPDNLEKAINEQIKIEEHSSRLYMAMASWCETNGFPGAARFLYEHSDEERMHMLKFVHFLNDRNGKSILQALEELPSEYDNLGELFDKVLAHEQFVTRSINNLVDLCLQEKDHTTNNFLQWFVMEQIEEESLVQGIVDKIKLIGDSKGGYFHLDNYLDGLAAGEAAEEA
jgi:ferritin